MRRVRRVRGIRGVRGIHRNHGRVQPTQFAANSLLSAATVAARVGDVFGVVDDEHAGIERGRAIAGSVASDADVAHLLIQPDAWLPAAVPRKCTHTTARRQPARHHAELVEAIVVSCLINC